MKPHLPPENGFRMPSSCNNKVLVVRAAQKVVIYQIPLGLLHQYALSVIIPTPTLQTVLLQGSFRTAPPTSYICIGTKTSLFLDYGHHLRWIACTKRMLVFLQTPVNTVVIQ